LRVGRGKLKRKSLVKKTQVEEGKIQSFSSKHGKKRKAMIKKYSHREKNRLLDYVNKFVNKLLNMYSMATFAVEKLNKQKMFEDANDKLSKKIYRTVWRSIQHVLKYKAPFMALLLRK
jgi:putative transposase